MKETYTMGDKRQETITKYLGDMKAAVHHVEQAMERQKDELRDDPQVSQLCGLVALGLQRQRADIDRELEGRGGSPTAPVKEGVAAVAGVLAGLYNKVRTEGPAKSLRDDHTALNWLYVSWTTLHTTAVALGDSAVADLAKRSFGECARWSTQVDRLLPETVFRELSDGDLGRLDATAPQQTHAAAHAAWGGEVRGEVTSS